MDSIMVQPIGETMRGKMLDYYRMKLVEYPFPAVIKTPKKMPKFLDQHRLNEVFDDCCILPAYNGRKVYMFKTIHQVKAFEFMITKSKHEGLGLITNEQGS